ncbi:MAG: hypothetical protein ACLQVI_35730 [Polyangiaceae bacterium]
MTPRALARLLLAYVAFAVILSTAVHRAASLRKVDGEHVYSGWRKGELAARNVNGEVVDVPGLRIVDEHVVGEGALLTSLQPVFALSIVAGVDGVKATLNGLTAYVTPDDLLSRQAYDKGFSIPSLMLSFGADVPVIEALLAQRLGTTVPELRAHAVVRRIRMVRSSKARQPFAATKPDEITPQLLRDAATAAAGFLARGVTVEGRFRYIVDAPTNRTLPGYDWPRHAGATYFLAQASEIDPSPSLRDAALRSAHFLRDTTLECAGMRCVGSDQIIDIGSSALALIAMSEIARTGLDASYRVPVAELAKFLRAQQRPDGEFMHFFDRRTNQRIDKQVLYYSGEATLALARAYELNQDPADLDAARRGLAHLVGPAWSFFGNRYYFGEEHWTCLAMADLWDSAPDPKALDFCERWREYDAHMMYGPGETSWDADGAFGVGPLVTPRLTPVGSRTEAGAATLEAMIKANVDPSKRAALASQLRRSLALILRQQFRPGPLHLFADPSQVMGAMPGSQVDWQLRIDYAQHAGSAMIRAASVAGL